jgi:mannose-1-phosphate guanylyltransferase/phosphomannomutase
MMATTRSHLGELRRKYQHYVRSETSVPCPWGKKGLVMRRLITESVDKDRQLIDGVRIFEKNGWVLVAPDRFQASFNIVAETNSSEETAGLISRYQTIVEDCQKS